MIPPRNPSDARPSRLGGNAPAQNRWSHPGFLLSAGVMAVVLALAVYLAVGRFGDDPTTPAKAPVTEVSTTPTTSTSSSSTSPRTSTSADPQAQASICGLADPPHGTATDGDTTDPATSIDNHGVTWSYQNATAYPVSSTYGPARKDPAGFRYCFQHSAGGALFTAAGFIALSGSGESEIQAWAGYILADGPYRSTLLQQLGTGEDTSGDTSGRTEIVGYRVRSYSPDEAWIDIAVQTSDSDQSVLASVILDLVWQHGDWRISTKDPSPMNASRIADLTGYTAWGAA